MNGEFLHAENIRLAERIAALRAALRNISTSPHCLYENNPATEYGYGIADGHRCAANNAKAALVADEKDSPNAD